MSYPTLPVAILAGGLATRLRPITQTIPKALVPVAGEPFLTHQLRLLARNNLREIVLCVGHLGEQIEAAYGDGQAHRVHLSYSYDGPELRGTAGALRQALPLLGNSFLVLYGDSYLDIDYAAVTQNFLEGRTAALMTVMENSAGTEPSNVWFKNNHVLAYSKKNPRPEMRHIDYGLSVYQAKLVADYSGNDLSGLQETLAQEGLLRGFEIGTPYYEMGSHSGLKDLEDYLGRQQPRL